MPDFLYEAYGQFEVPAGKEQGPAGSGDDSVDRFPDLISPDKRCHQGHVVSPDGLTLSGCCRTPGRITPVNTVTIEGTDFVTGYC